MTRMTWYGLLVALVIFIGFGWLCWFMAGNAVSLGQDHQYVWDRLVLLFNAVQSFASAAVGALLGTAVQQARVVRAEATAEANAADAEKARSARNLIANLQPPGGGQSSAPVESIAAVLK
jgi:hypothetical protein